MRETDQMGSEAVLRVHEHGTGQHRPVTCPDCQVTSESAEWMVNYETKTAGCIYCGTNFQLTGPYTPDPHNYFGIERG